MIFSKGVRLMLTASFFFALMNVLVKQLAHIPAVEIVFFRALISLALSWYMLKKQQIPLWGNNKKVLFARGFFGTVALVMLFATFQGMPLATATILHYLSPIFTTLIVFFLIGEKFYRIQLLFFAISIAGIVLIKGFDTRVSGLYFFFGVANAFLAGCAYACIRKLKTSEHPLVIVFYFPLVALPLTGAISIPIWEMPQGMDWLYLIGIGILTQIAQVFMTKAYQAEEAVRVGSVNYVGMIYALIFGYFIFGETFNWQAYVGMALVLVGVLLNISYKQWSWRFSKKKQVSFKES